MKKINGFFLIIIITLNFLYSSDFNLSENKTEVEDVKELISFLEKNKSPRNSFYLGNIYLFGIFDKKGNDVLNEEKGLFYLKQASEENYELSNIILGDYYTGIEKNKENAEKYYLKALKSKNFEEIIYNKLFDMYVLFDDFDKGFYYLKIAADEKKISEAQLKISTLYKNGLMNKIKPDLFLANKYLNELCSKDILKTKIRNYCNFYKN